MIWSTKHTSLKQPKYFKISQMDVVIVTVSVVVWMLQIYSVILAFPLSSIVAKETFKVISPPETFRS